eukprot:CAMPEP_0184494678 /NCGR_PEP_ID=MMETSP0113_2-20130426/29336_1 /TAXON_ID=91329 /ORGANISM="Norrisiella sphaerica, Strain BC52" /LENGTH=211 /DNA_ID=CAMNT_0026880533 /DNA_START=531 /DNA_END=1166 /DNA_ORIENTATION=+
MTPHMDDLCPHRAVKCVHCKELIRLSHMRIHYLSCREMLVACACGNRCPRKVIVQHCLVREGMLSLSQRGKEDDSKFVPQLSKCEINQIRRQATIGNSNKAVGKQNFGKTIGKGSKKANKKKVTNKEKGLGFNSSQARNLGSPPDQKLMAGSMTFEQRMKMKRQIELAKNKATHQHNYSSALKEVDDLVAKDVSKMTLADKVAMKRRFGLK